MLCVWLMHWQLPINGSPYLEGDKLSMCASSNPLSLLFIVSNRGTALVGKTQACLLAWGQSSHSRFSQMLWLILCCCTFGITFWVKMNPHELKLAADKYDYVTHRNINYCNEITIEGKAVGWFICYKRINESTPWKTRSVRMSTNNRHQI